mgnify:CR=1 FL=1
MVAFDLGDWARDAVGGSVLLAQADAAQSPLLPDRGPLVN